MKIALAQINTTVGDFAGNVDRIVTFARRAAERGADVVVFPELSLCGYPPRDLVEKPSFLDRSAKKLNLLARETASLDLALICGYVSRSRAAAGKQIQNSAAVIERGEIIFHQHKML